VKHCDPAWLVAPPFEIPSDPSVAYDGGERVFGCNHVVCRACGADVKHADGRGVTSHYAPVASELQALYDSTDPGSSPLLDSAPRHADSRTYFCRCDWYAVVTSGKRRVSDTEKSWECAGHAARVPDAEDREAEARKAVDALVAATVPIPASAYKIRFKYAPGVNPEFSTASTLRDSLLASYPDGVHAGRAVVRVGRDDSLPAWGWVVELIRRRSDWLPALGIALQHAARDGGEIARTGLVDLLADFRDSIVLLPWTTPLAREWPDVAARGSGTGWGSPDYRLETIVGDQTKALAEITTDKTSVYLAGYGKDGKVVRAPFTNETELRSVLDTTARAGQFPDGDKGPWSWLGFELLIGAEWLRPAFVKIVRSLEDDDSPNVFALLDWFSEEQDLWRFVGLLTGWHAMHPAWWETPANKKPSGWKRTMRSAHWPEVTTLGDVVVEALRRAKGQVVTPPVVDLPLLYGSSIS
jgi:hypothetical protein